MLKTQLVFDRHVSYIECDVCKGESPRDVSPALARARAAQAGWHIGDSTRHERDLCPSCYYHHEVHYDTTV